MGWQRSRHSCGKTRHATFPEVMKTDGNKHTHSHTHTHTNPHKPFTDERTAPIRGTEDRARLHFSCSCLSLLLTQIYCKEIAAQIGMHAHVKDAPGVSRSENTKSEGITYEPSDTLFLLISNIYVTLSADLGKLRSR